MRKIIFLFVWIGGVLLGSSEDSVFNLWPTSGFACDYCLLTQGLSPLETTQGLGLRLDERYTVLHSMFSGSQEVTNHDNEKETHFTTQVTAFYNINERFTIIGILPIPRRSVSVNPEDTHAHEDEAQATQNEGPVHSHSASGSAFNISDLTIMGRYTFLRKHDFQESTLLAFQAGVKMPTGRTDALDDTGNILDAHIQPGTGSWNFLAGLSFNYVKNRFGLSSNVLYSINTTGRAGDDDYRFGNWLNADITAKYPVLSANGKHAFLSLGLNGEFRGKEEINGQIIENTGGEVLYLAPGVQVMMSRVFIIEASLLYPFYHNLNGVEQLGEDFKTFFGVNYLLN